MTEAPPPLAPAGWQPDPTRRYRVRYWEGAVWTAHVFNGSTHGIGVDPLEVGPRAATTTTATTIDSRREQLVAEHAEPPAARRGWPHNWTEVQKFVGAVVIFALIWLIQMVTDQIRENAEEQGRCQAQAIVDPTLDC